MLVDATSYLSQRDRELERIGGGERPVSRRRGVCIDARKGDEDASGEILSDEEYPDVMAQEAGDLASVTRGSRRCLHR